MNEARRFLDDYELMVRAFNAHGRVNLVDQSWSELGNERKDRVKSLLEVLFGEHEIAQRPGVANGLFMLIGVYIAQPFWPEAKLRWEKIREPIDFGLKVAGSNVIYQFYRNVDYLLVGRFLGLGPLGVYRTTFELAMSPAIAVLAVMNRTALPVFSRIADDREETASGAQPVEEGLRQDRR